jgi:hypothetical protein
LGDVRPNEENLLSPSTLGRPKKFLLLRPVRRRKSFSNTGPAIVEEKVCRRSSIELFFFCFSSAADEDFFLLSSVTASDERKKILENYEKVVAIATAIPHGHFAPE